MDWEKFYRLYLAAPEGYEAPSDLKVAFSNSMFQCFAYDSGRLIAVGRAVADGRDCSYISGVAVHLDHQGHGIGRDVVTRLITLSKGHKKIILYTAPGKEPFYSAVGVTRREQENGEDKGHATSHSVYE